MNQGKDADSGGAPDAADRPRRRIASLPGPRPGALPAALGAPSPTIVSAGERTPVAEISSSPGSVYITIELPGAPKDSLDIQATETSLRVVAPRVGAATYRLEIALPVRVDPKSAKATYRNGILDVTLQRSDSVGGGTHDL